MYAVLIPAYLHVVQKQQRGLRCRNPEKAAGKHQCRLQESSCRLHRKNDQLENL